MQGTYPPAGFAVPPAALLGVERLAVYPLFKLRTGHTKQRAEKSSKPHMHACIRDEESHASQSTQKNHSNFTQNPRTSREIATTWRSLHVDPVGAIGESAPDGASFPRTIRAVGTPRRRRDWAGSEGERQGKVVKGGKRHVLASPAEVGVHGEGRARADLPPAAPEGVGVGVLAVGVPADRALVQRRLRAQIHEVRRRRRLGAGNGPRLLRLLLWRRRRFGLDKGRLHRDGGPGDRRGRGGRGRRGRRGRRRLRRRRRRRHGRAEP